MSYLRFNNNYKYDLYFISEYQKKISFEEYEIIYKLSKNEKTLNKNIENYINFIKKELRIKKIKRLI